MKHKKGFSLIESLLAIVIASILLMLALPNSTKVKSTAEDNSMKMRAMALTTAKMEFVRDAGSSAATAWNSASSDQAKYDLLKGYIGYPPESLADYSIEGYSIAPGANVLDAVTLYLGSDVIDYTSANQ